MEKVVFGDDIPGYVCGEQGNPGVVVIQEWWGVTPIICDHALKISKAGYRCLIPDIYKGKIGVDKEEASHLMNALDFKEAVEEIKAAADYLRITGSEKVGVIGFCMGGALTLGAAQHATVDCAAPCYGTPPPEIAQPENIKVPTLMSFGELDEFQGFADPATAKAYSEKINEAGGHAILHMYPHCGHAFLNTGGEAVKKRLYMGFPEPPTEVQELAWRRILEFFDKYLKQ